MPSGNAFLLIAFAVVVAALALLAFVVRVFTNRLGALPYYSKDVLLSKGELAFFHVLRRAVPPHLLIAPKVRLGDLIGCPAAARKKGFGGKISQKHVDFVLFDAKTSAIALVVELDDRTHRQSDRRDRDVFVDRALAAAGIPILHVPAARAYDAEQLKVEMAQKHAPAA